MSKKKIFFNTKNMQYIEGIIYILFIIVIIFANTYGSIYLTMIPFLVILGVVGKLVFDRPVTTTVFGIVVSLCIVYTKGHVGIWDNILVSLCAGLNISLGELLGKYLKLSYKCIKKKKKKNIKADEIKIYAFTIFVFILTLGMHIYINGDYFSYEKCKKALVNYIEKTYGEDSKFEIIDAKYHFLKNRNYVFRIRNVDFDDVNKFTIYLKDTKNVNDEYKDILLAKNNNEINNNLQLYLMKNNISNDFSKYNILVQYTEVTKIELAISRTEDNISDSLKSEFANDVVKIVERLKDFEQFDKIEQLLISIKFDKKKDSLVSAIYMSSYNDIIKDGLSPYEYIMDSLEVEYIDQQ